MLFHKTTSIVLAAITCAVISTGGYGQTSSLLLESSQPLRAQLSTNAQRLLLTMPASHIVQLRFVSEGVHLDLRDGRGKHLRRLVEDGRGAVTVTWITQGADQEQLWVVAANQESHSRSFTAQVVNVFPMKGVERPQADDTPMGLSLQQLQQTLAQGQTTDTFWHEVQQRGTPLVEPWDNGKRLVTFLWRDEGNQNVRLFGSPSGDHNPLRKLQGSDVWWTSVVMDSRARLSYALAPDVPKVENPTQQRRMILSTLQRDPLNPKVFPASLEGNAMDVYQGRSLLVLPDAPTQPWVQDGETTHQGKLNRYVMHSKVLDNTRDVFTYVPASATPQALLVLFDAHAFLKDVNTPRILDKLIADGILPPTAVVLVGNASPEARAIELPPNPKFAQFIAQELMPWVQMQGLSQLARNTVVAGSSYGGLVSSYLGLQHPELFGNVLSMSGSFWWSPQGEASGWMQRAWQGLTEPMPHVRFYLDAGLYETGRGGRDGILETTRELSDILRKRGLTVTQREWVSGHDYAQWQSSLGCGLVALLAPKHFQNSRLQACAGARTE